MVLPAEGLCRPTSLSRGHFRRIAVNGFGDGCNSYAWGCTWYDDHVYIGTNRHVLVLVKERVVRDMPAAQWPVPLCKPEELDLRGQIWRYRPRAGTWERVYLSPMTKGLEDRDVPLAYGFRNMAAFQGKSDPRPALYTIPSCGRYGLGPVLLRSIDGVRFEVASEPGLGLGDSSITTYRGVVPFRGQLFISPSGSRGGHSNSSYNAVILCSDDPARGTWQLSNPPDFGDPTNHGIFDLGVCGQYLYAGTINPRQGAQLWKTDAEGPPPHRWTKVFDRGADRGSFNEAIVSFAAFQGDLYLGTGIQNGGRDRDHGIGPAAGEVIRVHSDDTWDLVMGEPRLTRWGLKAPSSGLGPGFENSFAGYIWRMAAHDGALYVGTYDSSSFLPYSDSAQWPEHIKRMITPETLEQFMEQRGGCELWRTTDGDHWEAVTRNGFGNRFNWGVRSMLPTPVGLFIGTANPFGPKVAVQGPAGWRYDYNPLGGTEVWHGCIENSGAADGRHLGNDDDGSWLLELATQDRNRDRSAPSADELEALVGSLPDEFVKHHRRHAIAAVEAEERKTWGQDPVLGLGQADKDLVGLAEDVAEELDEYYAGSDLRNVGYWRNPSTTPTQASEQLLDELLPFLPPAGEKGAGRDYLVIGTGARAIAGRLQRLQPAAAVTTFALAEELELGGRLPLPDAAFSTALWIEGPSGTDRSGALRQVRRLLKPGGQLLATDIIGCPFDRLEESAGDAMNPDVLKSYQRDLEQAGFANATVLDVTHETWLRFYKHSRDFFMSKLLFQQIDQERHDQILGALPGGGLAVQAYVFVSATKPGEA